jgi:hypothetical protein
MAAPHETHRHAQHSDPSRAQHSGPSQRPYVPIYPASESLATSSSHSQHIPSRSRSGNLTPFLLPVCYSSRMLSLHVNRILLIPPLRSPPDSRLLSASSLSYQPLRRPHTVIVFKAP